MKSFKQRCIDLRNKDYSLLEIAKITGRPKTSVYHHVRGMPLSAGRLQRRYEQNVQHLTRLADTRRGKSRRVFRTFSTWSPELVALTAHLLFDGEISARGCFYNNRNDVLLAKVERLMERIYEFAPARYVNKTTGVKRICYFNVALGAYMETKARELLRDIRTQGIEHKRAFLRAFFDDEGCMDFRPQENRRRIRGYQKETRILQLIVDLLTSFNIASRVVEPNEVIIIGKNNLIAFKKEIGFSPGVTVNGNRTNSTWKKHLEKRELLRRAIDSYIKV